MPQIVSVEERAKVRGATPGIDKQIMAAIKAGESVYFAEGEKPDAYRRALKAEGIALISRAHPAGGKLVWVATK